MDCLFLRAFCVIMFRIHNMFLFRRSKLHAMNSLHICIHTSCPTGTYSRQNNNKTRTKREQNENKMRTKWDENPEAIQTKTLMRHIFDNTMKQQGKTKQAKQPTAYTAQAIEYPEEESRPIWARNSLITRTLACASSEIEPKSSDGEFVCISIRANSFERSSRISLEVKAILLMIQSCRHSSSMHSFSMLTSRMAL